jgi:hypothetical protein
MKFFAIVLFLSGALLTGCGSKETELAPQIKSLIGNWKLVEPDSSYAVTLQIEYDSANPPHDVTPFLVNGKSAVNDYNLRLFAAIDGMMSADNLSSTKKAGSPEAMKFEQTYFTNLRAVVRYELLTEKRLRLLHGGEQPHVLVYEKVN